MAVNGEGVYNGIILLNRYVMVIFMGYTPNIVVIRPPNYVCQTNFKCYLTISYNTLVMLQQVYFID